MSAELFLDHLRLEGCGLFGASSYWSRKGLGTRETGGHGLCEHNMPQILLFRVK